jgi:hypothetical protein
MESLDKLNRVGRSTYVQADTVDKVNKGDKVDRMNRLDMSYASATTTMP